MTRSPDKKYDNRQEHLWLPSWSANPNYVNQEHHEIFDKTKNIPGWQAPGDTYKLYEMGYFAGDVILEIGIYSGRSAVVELRGALSNPDRSVKPQFFGVDVSLMAIPRTYEILQQENLTEYALLYFGTLELFVKEFSIKPTMVFLDGDHSYEWVKQDLDCLSNMLCEGVPVLCHDYLHKKNDTGIYGVRRAVDEWEQAGYAEFCGLFGVSALLTTTTKCKGRGPCQGLSPQAFTSRKEELLIQQLQRQSEQLQNLRLKFQQQSNNLEQPTAENKELRRLLDILQNPWGWRITGPLRKIAKALRRS
jgi:hypothetical protein